MRSIRLSAALAAALVCVDSAPAQVNFSDGFEASTIDPFWTVFTNSGSIVLSNQNVFQGSQSVKFSTVDTGNNKDVGLNHPFSDKLYGTTTISVFDSGANQLSGNYISLVLVNTTTQQGKYIGTKDFDLGPGNGGDVYYVGDAYGGDGIRTNVDRTQAWHTFSIHNTATFVDYFIDGNLAYHEVGGFEFDRVQIELNAPFSRPPMSVFFDSFSISASPVPEPSPVFLAAGGFAVLLSFLRLRRARAAS
jgi:hypothetical protein